MILLVAVDKLERRIKAQKILASSMSDDLKLFEIFKIYSEDLKKENTELYYALLGWRDIHLKDLMKEECCNGNQSR